jgi:YVTN family beta-propeller protein
MRTLKSLRWALFALFVVTTAPEFLLSQTQSDASGYLVVVNKSEDSLAFVDAQALRLVGKVAVGKAPHEVTVSRDGRFAFVANYGTREAPGNSISVVDLSTRTHAYRIELGKYTRPHGLTVTPDGTLWVTTEGSRTLLGIDPVKRKIKSVAVTGQEVSHMVAATPDGRKLYVANIGSGTVTVVRSDGTVLKQIDTGAGAEGVAVHPNGREAWVTNRSANTISIIDTNADTVLATLPSATMPIRVQFTPNGRLALVSNARSNEVAVFDVESRKEVRRIRTGSAPIGLLVRPDGKVAYVANTRSDEISVVDLKTWKVVTTLKPGDEPDGMAWVSKTLPGTQ